MAAGQVLQNLSSVHTVKVALSTDVTVALEVAPLQTRSFAMRFPTNFTVRVNYGVFYTQTTSLRV